MGAPTVGGEDTCDGAWKMRGGRRRSLNKSQASVITLLVIWKWPDRRASSGGKMDRPWLFSEASSRRRMAPVGCVQRKGRRGLNSATIEGMLEASSPYLAVMDGDLQHDEALLPRMLHVLRAEVVDIVVGSRYVTGGCLGDWARAKATLGPAGGGRPGRATPFPVNNLPDSDAGGARSPMPGAPGARCHRSERPARAVAHPWVEARPVSRTQLSCWMGVQNSEVSRPAGQA